MIKGSSSAANARSSPGGGAPAWRAMRGAGAPASQPVGSPRGEAPRIRKDLEWCLAVTGGLRSASRVEPTRSYLARSETLTSSPRAADTGRAMEGRCLCRLNLPDRASLDYLKKLAKERLLLLRATESRRRRLADAQLAIAREYGFPSWRALKAEIDRRRERRMSRSSFGVHDRGPGRVARAVAEGPHARARASCRRQLRAASGRSPPGRGAPADRARRRSERARRRRQRQPAALGGGERRARERPRFFSMPAPTCTAPATCTRAT